MMESIQAILNHYPLAALAEVSPLGNRGGFSGARLWRGRCRAGDFCLRAWPDSMTRPRLAHIHRMMDMAVQTGLSFVPRVHRTHSRETYVGFGACLWEVTDWMPGRADFHALPSAVRLGNACTTLAELHRAWAEQNPVTAPCPAVLRRLERIRRWQELTSSGWRPDFGRHPEVSWHAWTRRAWPLVQKHMPELPALLVPWLNISVPLQTCLCDIWHDHVLYTGDALTGLVDYGSIKTDHIAVDLARLLGSLVGDDAHQRHAGLEAYARVAPLSAQIEQLIDVLDRSGTVLGAANWLMWLYHDGRAYPDSAGVAQRLTSLVQRMENW